jgi:hypothetical protein
MHERDRISRPDPSPSKSLAGLGGASANVDLDLHCRYTPFPLILKGFGKQATSGFRQADDLAGLGSGSATANMNLDLHDVLPSVLFRVSVRQKRFSGPWQQRGREP